MLTDLLILAPAALALLFLIAWRKPSARADVPPANAIVVDGSNVLHWNGEPSVKVLRQVLRAIEAKGLAPIVFFDASVGYKIGDRYYDEAAMAKATSVPENQICVVNKGVVADEAILAFAGDHNLRVITNDQFRDWRIQFPHAGEKGRIVRGQWREGSVVWRGTL